ncbi:hypothetical protein D9756_006599 [Leucocoprinus leucothites]|uniref:BTB domain-containing protein n=1 Tax=Leucocoprinus leucothites TaxID=201217 RepID=A0A8H5G2N4_9AGAR|nr:hypothetical protein D9756_006599 [Leucoagaricus leucothites]
MTHTTLARSAEIPRDDLYYFDDGSCVFQVEDTLFNLHRSILCRNSNFFRNLFSGPQSTVGESKAVESERLNDHSPIKCADTTVEAFRAWCWAIYAGFNEFEGLKTSENFTEEQFIHIGSLAHKYECDIIEKWARGKLEARLAKSPRIPRAVLEYAIRTSMKCNWPSVKTSTEALLIATISGPRDTSLGTSNTGADLREILRFADSIGNAELSARAYYAFLCSVGWNLSPKTRNVFSESRSDGGGGEMWWDDLGALTDRQKICLYRGFQAMTSISVQLRTLPAAYRQRCDCTKSLFEKWSEKATKLEGAGSCDPRQFLKEMKKVFPKQPSGGCGHKNGCWVDNFQKKVNQLSKDVDGALSGFFSE